MKRAGILALCALGVAAAVVSVQAMWRNPGQREAAQVAADAAALTPRLGSDGVPKHDGEPLAPFAPDTPRVDITSELDITFVRDESTPDAEPPSTADHLLLRLVAGGARVSNAGSSIDCVAFNVDPMAILDDDVELVRAQDGELWLARHTLEALVAEADPVRPLHLALLDRGITRERIGFIGGPVDAAVSELVLQEVGAAYVQLRTRQRGTSRFELSVHAQLLDANAGDARMELIAMHMGGLMVDWGSVELGPDVEGESFPRGLLPGRWSLSFHLPGAPLMQIAPVVVELVPGRNEVSIEVPELFELTVHAPSLGVGERLRLRSSNAAASAATGRAARDYAALDTNHRVVFSGLPPGHYVLTHGASHAPENIVVPCGEVLYEPRRSDAFEVQLAPLDGGGQGALARAGFQSGDVVLDFNGRGLREHDDLEALLAVIAENEASVRVRRGAHTLTLQLGPMPDPGNPWATFDADFVPAWR